MFAYQFQSITSFEKKQLRYKLSVCAVDAARTLQLEKEGRWGWGKRSEERQRDFRKDCRDEKLGTLISDDDVCRSLGHMDGLVAMTRS
jgi:hypothetical protein